jgi:hypothetical protein
VAIDQQKQLKKFLDRRHPLYEAMFPQWNFYEETYEGGRAWFVTNIHRYLKEGDGEYKDRVSRAYRFNHTREVVDLVDKYIFKMAIARDHDNAPDSIKDFWKHATLRKEGIDVFMKTVSRKTSIFGRIYIVVDSTMTDEVTTKADEKEVDARTYAYVVDPRHVLDMSLDEMGELNWILIHELVRDDVDPINSTGAIESRYRLWTREDSILFLVERQGNKVIVKQQEAVPHKVGVVPVFAADNILNDEKYASPSMIADVAYLDRAVANYLSNLDAIIQDQTYSQLAMPAQGLSPGEDAYQKLLEMGTKRIFIYDGENGAQPHYLSPDVKQAELLLSVVNKIINEIYHSVGLAGERTKEDNAVGIDNSSGVAKAYDFGRVNALLAQKADSLEEIENKLCWFAAKYDGEDLDELLEEEEGEKEESRLVLYPDDFDVRGLYDELELSARLALIEAPDSMRRKQMEKVLAKLFPHLAADLKEKITKELNDWPPEEIDPLTGQPAPNGAKPSGTVKKEGNNSRANKLVNS